MRVDQHHVTTEYRTVWQSAVAFCQVSSPVGGFRVRGAESRCQRAGFAGRGPEIQQHRFLARPAM